MSANSGILLLYELDYALPSAMGLLPHALSKRHHVFLGSHLPGESSSKEQRAFPRPSCLMARPLLPLLYPFAAHTT